VRRGWWTSNGSPPPPFSPEYIELHKTFVTRALLEGDLVKRFVDSRKLPKGYGVGFDERVVEYPWLLAQGPHGRVLDAGSALNHAYVLDRLMPMVGELHIVTLAPEVVAFTERRISYIYADLRELPLRDARYDTIVCVSTLDHVGMDNAQYGAPNGRADDPNAAALEAVLELKRVLALGGVMLLTVPYGAPMNQGWMRQFDRGAIEEVIAAMEPRQVDVTVYAYSRDGWQISSLDAAADRRYYDVNVETEIADDFAAAARAVACIRAIK
jgi:SAM-dependent methyltransferase